MGDAQEAPDGFLFGASISVYQNSGGSKTNWATFEDHTGCTGSPKMAEPVGISSDFWNMYETDIGLAAALNCRALRLSLEWSRIEPERGRIDEAAIGRYHAMLDVMQRCGPNDAFVRLSLIFYIPISIDVGIVDIYAWGCLVNSALRLDTQLSSKLISSSIIGAMLEIIVSCKLVLLSPTHTGTTSCPSLRSTTSCTHSGLRTSAASARSRTLCIMSNLASWQSGAQPRLVFTEFMLLWM